MPTATPPFDTPGAPQNLKGYSGEWMNQIDTGHQRMTGSSLSPTTSSRTSASWSMILSENYRNTAIIDGLPMRSIHVQGRSRQWNWRGEGSTGNPYPDRGHSHDDGHVRMEVPAAGAIVSLLDESGNVILDATTDAEGYCSRCACRTLQVERGEVRLRL